MGEKHKYNKNELADQSDVRECVREVTAAIGDTALSASDGVTTGNFRESRDVTEYQNLESSKGACSHLESPNCERSGGQPRLSGPNVDAELAGLMDTSIRHTDERVAALEEGLRKAVAAIHRLGEKVETTSSAVGARVAKLDLEVSTLKSMVSSTVSVSPQKKQVVRMPRSCPARRKGGGFEPVEPWHLPTTTTAGGHQRIVVPVASSVFAPVEADLEGENLDGHQKLESTNLIFGNPTQACN